ncbi:MAG: hypothetical protein A2287_02340 [Candidatus Melainabacteria bacterium RIFOXYA12_FULL_32_12]|nr:MAG: hypothetical protein A2255_09785 [Candidatus Melainabacteria bacterium RIFOXYA2_FULL_32_9]OGI26342.1 MAG: hypothetical protein A2287_02340 [Candidatus Melainabacteria bacterium RIFOXYA12_FULL_32_12]
MSKTLNFIKDVGKGILDHDYPGLASEMAYNLILSLFPFAIFAVSIFGLFGTPNNINQIINLLNAVAPTETLHLIRDVLNEIFRSSSTGLLSIIALIGALWTSSRAILSIAKGMNRAYEVPETRSFIKLNGLALLTVIMFAIVLLISVNLTIFGTTILEFLSRFLPISNDVSTTVLLVRWPITLFSLFTITLIIYYFLPNVHFYKKKLLLSSVFGSLFFSIFWLFGSWLFSLYVENFARYNAVYGTLGAFIVLLIWLYYTSLIMLIGGEISSELYKVFSPKIVEVKNKP